MVAGFQRFGALLLVIVSLVLLVAACAAPAAPAPAATPAGTAADKASAAPTAPAIRWAGGKLQPLPDGYPNKAIAMMTTKAGSTGDIFFRGLAKAAEPLSPVPLVVENRDPMPDVQLMMIKNMAEQGAGYFMTSGTGSNIMWIYTSGSGLKLEDLQPITVNDSEPLLVTVKGDAPWKTLAELVAYSKSKPGTVRVTTGGTGNWIHVAALWLSKEAKAEFRVVPGPDSGTAALTVMGEAAEVAVASTPALVPNLEAGKLRALAVASAKRLPDLPDIPTLKEQGVDVEFELPMGLVVPSGVSKQRVQWLYELFKKAVESPDWKETQKKIRHYPLDLGPEDSTKLYKKLDEIAAKFTMEYGMRAK